MTLTVEEAIGRVPLWAGVKLEDMKISPLSGGITNNNFRVEVSGEAFVLRITGANTEMLGIDRNQEYEANLMAGRLGIAPEVVYFIQPEGYLITRFIAGRPILPEEMCRPENIRRAMEVVRRIHRMPALSGNFSVFRVIDSYTEIARRYRVPFPEDFDRLMGHVREAESALMTHPGQPCPCHNDLLNANFLTDGQLYVLDWEYAGMGNPYFDLANFSDHHSLSEEQDAWLLECYFGEVTSEHFAHLKIMKVLSDLREATWGLVQIGISKLDFDFRDYADRFFDRVYQNMPDLGWGQWLKEVTNPA
jgi:thiamine kinase-like enzyme